MNELEELERIFREEAQEFIDKLAVLLEELKTANAEQHRDILNEVLRLVHNIKGAARTVGFQDIENLAHAIEDALQPAKQVARAITADRFREILRGVTLMQLSLDGKAEPEQVLALIASLSRDNVPTIDNSSSNDSQKTKETKETKETDPPSKGPPETKSQFRGSSSIRVDTLRFDRVMGFSGELLVSHARMAARHQRLDSFLKEMQKLAKQAPENARLFAPLLKQARPLIQEDRKDLLDFDHLTQEISEAMKQVRMVPLSRAEPEWRHTVREAAHQSAKEIGITIHTGDIELDKYVLDRLRDPMMHLLRNAVDHGIESAEERSAKGKPKTGRILIQTSVEGAMVRLEVNDDGRGIDLDKVNNAAQANGFISEDKRALLSAEETLELLFQPGFSTAYSVSRLSGRGVGLDVVRSQLEELGGSVGISSTANLGGTTFLLSVPLSILSTVGLFVRSGNTVYALPVEYVVRTLRIEPGEVKQVDGKTVIEMSHADPIRIVGLSDLMGAKKERPADKLKVIVLSRSDVQLGLVVDDIEGQQEFVIQALPWNLKSVPGVNGAIIRADGRLAISLDVPHVFENARLPTAERFKWESRMPSGEMKRILVVDDSMVSRTHGRNMLQAAGYQVTLAADGEEALAYLKKDSFDMVVSDVDMPKLNGFELTRTIRNSSLLNDLPIILVTTLDSPDDMAKGAEAGADEYVVKGTFDQQALLELVAKYI